MIIFDLDGTLADCEHRRHFVDRDKAAEKGICYEEIEITFGGVQNGPWVLTNDTDRLWKPDWKSFYEACDKDVPIEPVVEILDGIFLNSSSPKRFYENVQIWSGRCESIREKTSLWLNEYTLFDGISKKIALKMRPIGDTTPDDQLKEKWLDEALAAGKTIDFVFDDRPKVIRMWRRRGIFVFNCCQHDQEF
jgi:hypothetical protein